MHRPQCLRCTYSTVRHITASKSKCTAVRNPSRFTILGRNPGAPLTLPKCAVECTSRCWPFMLSRLPHILIAIDHIGMTSCIGAIVSAPGL